MHSNRSVKTGKYREGDELRHVGQSETDVNTAVVPDEVQESFATFVEDLLGPSV